LVSATSTFVKLFICLLSPDGASHSCPNYGPGMHGTFLFELKLYFFRTSLVWLSGLMLWKFDSFVDAVNSHKAARAKLRAVPRRGLLPLIPTVILLVAGSVLGLVGISERIDIDALKASATDGDINALIGQVWAMGLDVFVGGTTLAFLIVLLTTPMMNSAWAFLGLLISVGGVGLNVYELSGDIQFDVFGDDLANACGLVLSAIGVTVMSMLFCNQLSAKKEDDKLREKLTQAIELLDKDGDGEVSKAEFKKHFDELFPGVRFEPMWKQLDKDGDGSLSMLELASAFGMSHLVKEVEKLEADSDTFLDPTNRLKQMLAASQLSEQAGGLITYFLLWDVFVHVCTFGGIYLHLSSHPHISETVWKVHFALYAGKILVALLSFPFLIFFMPILGSALTHTTATAYDRWGKLQKVLPGADQKKRYIIEQQRRYVGYLKVKNECCSVNFFDAIEFRWNAYLGFWEVDKKAMKAATKYAAQLNEEFDTSLLIPSAAKSKAEAPAKPPKAEAPVNESMTDASIKPIDPEGGCARGLCASPDMFFTKMLTGSRPSTRLSGKGDMV